MKNILLMTSSEARESLLRPSSYCDLDLPSYFDFQPVLEKVKELLKKSHPAGTSFRKARDYDDINYKLLGNKDGAYSWRPFQILNPVLFVNLVNAITTDTAWDTITERFQDFQRNDKIRCTSIPSFSTTEAAQTGDIILNWWQHVEQESIKLSLEFQYVTISDITDCYGAIYTHSIPWALHGREVAKANRNDRRLIGNTIDSCLQDLQFGQTNGIPQGNTLSDFIAEIVLGYADLQLSDTLSETDLVDYQILRFRDDYRIFTNTPEDANQILLALTNVLAGLNLSLNSAKTQVALDPVIGALKKDKLQRIDTQPATSSLAKNLLSLYALSLEFPNSGRALVELSRVRKRLENRKKPPKNLDVLLALVTNLMYRNPRLYPVAASTISKLLAFIEVEPAVKALEKVIKKFKRVPNTALLEIWLQRIALAYDQTLIESKEKLTQVATGEAVCLWNSELKWLNNNALVRALTETSIVDAKILTSIDKVISIEETEVFFNKYPM